MPPERARVLWRCRRGTRELDILLERFMAEHYDGLDASGREAFARLLDSEDDQLADWLLSAKILPMDGPLAEIVRRIRASF